MSDETTPKQDDLTILVFAGDLEKALGAFIIAKAKNSPKEARDSVLHLKRYIKMLFERGDPE